VKKVLFLLFFLLALGDSLQSKEINCLSWAGSTPVSEKFDCGDLSSLSRQAECYFKSRQYLQAKEIYRQLVRKKSRRKNDIKNLIYLSQAAARSQDFETAIEANRTLILRYPRTSAATEALRKIAFLEQDSGNYGEAILLLKRLLKMVRSPHEQRALWEKIGWCYFRLGRYQEALESFDEGLAKAETPYLLYWKAKSLEHLESQRFQAQEIFKNLVEIYPATYYGFRSLQNLRRKKGKKFSRNILKQWWSDHDDYQIPYAHFLLSEIRKQKAYLDPFLLYGMMRQESHYRENIVSPAGAMGLLQIMPGTGCRLADEAGWNSFYVSWLQDPLTNIELSIRYVKKLEHIFPHQWYATVASYNAGEKVVAEWIKAREGLSEEEFIEEIPYGETRDYVKKVYTNWKAYQTIYGKDF